MLSNPVYSNKMALESMYDLTKFMMNKIQDLENENAKLKQELVDFKNALEKREQDAVEWVDKLLLDSEADDDDASYISCENDIKRQRIQ